jgi:membrane associated rhomboid family serine protease
LLLWAGINFVLGLSIGVVDNAAHLGGLLAGALFALAVSPYESVAPTRQTIWSILTAAAAVAPLIGFVLALLAA